jgi:pyridoxal phosphate enzyme (YggS family)
MITDEPASGSAARLAVVRANITAAAREAKRDPAAVSLVAVSKTFEAADIIPVLAAGQRLFGENRVQEAQKKWPVLRSDWPGIELHLIGPLQSNKAEDAVALFDVIQTVDRPKIAAALAAAMKKLNCTPRLLVQVNTGEEPQKAGIAPMETAAFVAHCRDDLGLQIEGLMCIPPVEDMAVVHFAFLAKLARELGLATLSMGMSADYEAAVSLGATHVRVGSAIFGTR